MPDKDYGQEMDVIVPALKTFTGLEVILSDQTEDYPEGMFITYKFVSFGQTTQKYGTKQVGQVLYKTLDETVELTISFTAIGADEFEVFGKAEKMRSFFLLNGIPTLKASGIAVANVGAVSQRHMFIVNDTEKRYGFDVRFRAERSHTMEIGSIDTAQISNTM